MLCAVAMRDCPSHTLNPDNHGCLINFFSSLVSDKYSLNYKKENIKSQTQLDKDKIWRKRNLLHPKHTFLWCCYCNYNILISKVLDLILTFSCNFDEKLSYFFQIFHIFSLLPVLYLMKPHFYSLLLKVSLLLHK